ncbi:MAG TPA: tetratricopeptide repeat protein [Polyangiaceae bacterium]|nr:tetratricopeptide repeat protein [Polyangiaceae bacterium]
MRAAFLIAPTYEACDEFRPHLHAAYDARAVGERLLEPGYDFEVFEAPKGVEPEVWLTEILKDKGQGETDALLVYVSAVSHLDEAGELSIEVMTGRATSRLPFTKLRTAISSRGSRSVVVVLDLLMDGPMDAVVATEYTAAARRVWAPELSGYSMLCAVRGRQPGTTPSVSPFTSLWLSAMADPQSRNKIGVAFISRVMDVMRENENLYTDVPCFSLVPGRRDLKVYSTTSPSLTRPSSSSVDRVSSPPSVRQPFVRVDDVFSEGDALLEAGDWEGASKVFKKILLLLEEKSVERAHAYVRLGAIKRLQNRPREAAIHYRKALGVDGRHPEALERLADVLRSEGEFAEAATYRRALLGVVQDDHRRFEVLLCLAEDFEKARDLARCIEALEDARSIQPEETAILARLAQVYDVSHQPDKVVDIKVAIAQLKMQPEEVARSLVLAADYAVERAQDVERALLIYEDALDRDPLTPRAFDAIAHIWIAREDLRAYEKALLAQTVRLDKAFAHAAEAEVWREIALLRHDKLDDLRGAIEALDRCVERVPGDVEARVALSELLVKNGEMEAAIMCLEIAAWHAPGRASTYRMMHELMLKVGWIDRAYCCAAVLVLLEEADLDEQLFYEQYHPEVRVNPKHSLPAKGWAKLYPAGSESNLGPILELVASHAIEYKLSWLKKNGMLPDLDPSMRQDPETSTVSLTRTFVWASTILDVPLPEIYVGDDVPGGIAAVPEQLPTAIVGRSVLSGRSLKELGFLVGRDIAYFRPLHYLLVLYSSLKDLTALFLASICVVRPDYAVPDHVKREIKELTRFLRDHLSEKESAALNHAVERFEQDGVRADLVGWARSRDGVDASGATSLRRHCRGQSSVGDR